MENKFGIINNYFKIYSTKLISKHCEIDLGIMNCAKSGRKCTIHVLFLS